MGIEVADRIKDCIRLLIGKRSPAYRDEEVIRLFELQTWIQFPDSDSSMVDYARMHAAAALLAAAEKRRCKAKPESGLTFGSAASLQHCLRQRSFAAMFDDVISNHGGWTQLANIIPYSKFDDEMARRWEQNGVVADLVSYMLRYTIHGRGKREDGNLSHAYAFCHSDPDRVPFRIKAGHLLGTRHDEALRRGERVTGRIFRSRWARAKEAAAFIYVDRYHPSSLVYEPDSYSRPPIERFRERVRDRRKLTRYFEFCAYVDEQTGGWVGADFFPDHTELRRSRPRTPAFSPAEQSRIANHRENHDKFRDS